MKAAGVALVCGLVLAAIFSITFSFAYQPLEEPAPPKKELLVYCDITVIKPLAEIARVIEQEENCRILIMKGGSGNLLRAIEVNQIGDLFLAGSAFYMDTCVKKGLVTEKVCVGHTKAAMMVQKGNPKRITNDLANLASPDYYVVIGDPTSGSIGRETKAILEKRGIFDQVLRNARQLTTDSKDLIKVLRDKEADLVVNWCATATWPEGAPYMTVLPISDEYASKQRLMLGLLRYSHHPGVAQKIMRYARSEKGRALFARYGLYDVE